MKGLFQGRMLVWFSCGAASAVAARIALDEYADDFTVEVCYCDTLSSEHPDNGRFLADCEEWLGVSIQRLQHLKYRHIHDVFRGERYIVGPSGAPCTRALKQKVRMRYELPGDIHVFGYTAEECARAERFERSHKDVDCEWVLIDRGITKTDCYGVIQEAGIELPAMYRLGYHNNNCLGCVKGGAGYWNKIRRDFPDVFEAMACLEREIGATVLRKAGNRLYLDELDLTAGRHSDLQIPPCGPFCCLAVNGSRDNG